MKDEGGKNVGSYVNAGERCFAPTEEHGGAFVGANHLSLLVPAVRGDLLSKKERLWLDYDNDKDNE